jgi:hypothetical protein
LHIDREQSDAGGIRRGGLKLVGVRPGLGGEREVSVGSAAQFADAIEVEVLGNR